MLTNFLIAAVCIFAFLHLKKIAANSRVHKFLRAYFIFMALATFFGGTLGHAFQYIAGPQWKSLGWICGMISIFLISHASILHASAIVGSTFTQLFKLVNTLALLIFIGLTIHSINFIFVQIHSSFGLLLLVMPLHIIVFVRTRDEGSKLMLLTICFTSLSAIVYSNKLSLGHWFNHLDIAHTILALSMYFFYLASIKFGVIPSSIIDSPAINSVDSPPKK